MNKGLKVIVLCAALVAIVALIYSFGTHRGTSDSAAGGDEAATPAAAKAPHGGMELQEKYGFAPLGE